MNSIRSRGMVAAALLLAVSLCGCGTSPDSRFYTLSALRPPDMAVSSNADAGRIIVALGPVTLPDYLDRPQIALRTSRNELELGEFDRWAGSLRSDVSRVLAENLSLLLAADSVTVVSWRQGIPSDCRITVDLSRFDVREGSDVLLKGQWAVFSGAGKGMLLMSETEIVEPLSGRGYEPAVASMGRALEGLGLEIAAGVRGLKDEIREVKEEGSGTISTLPAGG